MCHSCQQDIRPLLAGLVLLPALLSGGSAALGGDFPAVDCVITPYLSVDVSSAVPGLISKVTVDRSDRVEKDQVLAQLHSGVERAVVAYAKEKTKLTSEILLGEVNHTFDGRRLERLDSLYMKQVASYQDKDDAQRELALSRWELQRAQETVRLRGLELRKAQEQLKEKTVRSPIAGFVVQRYKTAGEYVEDQPIMRIAQLDPLYVEAIVPMELFGKIRLGMDAEVYPEFFEAEPRHATVSVIDQLGDAASGTFGVRLTLPNPDMQLPAGLKCQLQFDPNEPETGPKMLSDQPVISKQFHDEGGASLSP